MLIKKVCIKLAMEYSLMEKLVLYAENCKNTFSVLGNRPIDKINFSTTKKMLSTDLSRINLKFGLS